MGIRKRIAKWLGIKPDDVIMRIEPPIFVLACNYRQYQYFLREIHGNKRRFVYVDTDYHNLRGHIGITLIKTGQWWLHKNAEEIIDYVNMVNAIHA
jgi:hypothetical protein